MLFVRCVVNCIVVDGNCAIEDLEGFVVLGVEANFAAKLVVVAVGN